MTNEQTTIYFNPKCSKCRTTLALLKEKGQDPKVVNYLEMTPSKSELKAILALLGSSADQLLRKHESAYQEAGLSDNSTEDDILDTIMRHPILMERPIVIHRDKAVIGRPPETILTIL